VWQIAGPLAALGPPPVAEVAIRALGEFAVLLAGVPVPTAAWQSRKARDLVKLLAARAGGPIGRQTLAAALWPDAEGGITGRRLAVLISTVRGVIDPDHRRPAGFFLTADEASVRLDTRNVALDTAAFTAAARSALAAPHDEERLEAVAALYTGELCVGDESARVALADLHREVLRRLAAGARPETAAGWYRRIVATDRYDEAAHLGLIGVLTAAGRHGEARRAYDDYATAMHEIDVEPAPRLGPGTGRLNKT
jgi:DNA-binding SARP family transcriptional activator